MWCRRAPAGGECSQRPEAAAGPAVYSAPNRAVKESERALKPVNPHDVSTMTFDWGAIKWLVAPENTGEAQLSSGHVCLMPGKGHERHNHPQSEEILYILSGRGQQMVDDGEPFDVAPGDTIYIPTAAFHSTINTGWEPLNLLAIYNPAGPEVDLRALPDFGGVPAGSVPGIGVTR